MMLIFDYLVQCTSKSHGSDAVNVIPTSIGVNLKQKKYMKSRNMHKEASIVKELFFSSWWGRQGGCTKEFKADN